MIDPNAKTLDWPWGGDLSVSPSGGLALVSGVKQIEQRIVRRLLTTGLFRLSTGEVIQGEYYFHSEYGFSLRQRIGDLLSSNQAELLEHQIRQAVISDQSVDAKAPPVVNIYKAQHDVYIEILFTIADGTEGRIVVP